MSDKNKMEEEKPVAEQPKKNNKKDKKEKEDELSEEDKKLKENIELWVLRIQDVDTNLASVALGQLREEVRKTTTSMTSVPKPFKFLKAHYEGLSKFYESSAPSQFKKELADFLSVISMTMAERGKQISLRYLKEGTLNDFKNWGYEYLNHLSADIGQTYNQRIEKKESTDDLIQLVEDIVPYFVENNAEHDAVDLLLEVDKLQFIKKFVNKENFERISLYLQQCCQYCVDQNEMEETLKVNYEIALSLQLYVSALRLAIKLDDIEKIKEVFQSCKDKLILKQLCYLIARQRIVLSELDLDEDLLKIASNQHLTDFYLRFAKELDALEPKKPEQVYKSVLEDNKAQIDSLNANIADTYVNAFVNMGCKKDTLMVVPKTEKPWIYNLKKTGIAAATSSIGLIDMWDIESGTEHINEYLNLSDGYGKQGALIGIGLFSSGIVDENLTAKALLESELSSKDELCKLGAIIGLGMAYAGSANEDLKAIFEPIFSDSSSKLQITAFAALSLGLIFVGKCDEDISQWIIQILAEYASSTEKYLDTHLARYFAVAMGLLFLGQQERAEATIECMGIIEHDFAKYCEITIEGCAYAGSGNVLKVQKMLHHCTQKVEEDKSAFQQAAIVSLALISSSEGIGNEMAHRSLNHILQYCELPVKRAVPLALAILNISNPKINVMDLLLKFSHDDDQELSQRAIFSMGLVGAGTNNSRLADILRNLSSTYKQDSSNKFFIRIAQGLVQMGKGMVTLQPYYSDKFLLNKVGLSGIITVIHSLMDTKSVFGDQHYTMLYLGLAAYPRMLFTVDENGENKAIDIRVGQAVDVVGQAGKPKKITGFQTHQSPVLISYGERAELGSDEYIPLQATVLENIIIVQKNPDYVPEEESKNKRKQ
ncbi:26S proteasome regulatory subunit (macronuclear) [Tetrahymena thermophila SB210]|uniref:26S proteasome regulatory subunit n=1 Tax=Tetrahymena thermophila (strain SB210) TaxID=312017 RepID=I7M1R0_TETTS|nr:26S proteasome regulatory subunit [Tetrahymena thermophila SB210]EAR97380.1 26S proteasome regulatory subunit [Tetrahymena thermophila SB210]|eukprot:XP_001017625.1 26S proteasome regulatory subunit [Tetrahymena thermophila SB210]